MSKHPSAGNALSGFPTQVSAFLVNNSGHDSSWLSSETDSTKYVSPNPSPPPEKSVQNKFAFIYHTGPTVKDRESKRLIKKHVMVDIGKSRRRDPSSRKKAKELTSTTTNTESTDKQIQATNENDTHPNFSEFDQDYTSISRFSTTRDPFVRYPIKVSRRTRALIDHLFSEAFPEMTTIREAFFPVGLSDAAAFHQALAVLAIHLPFNRSKDLKKSADYEITEITIHHAQAVKLIKTRMSDVQAATSDGTIGAIILMVCHAYMEKDFVMWGAHMRGLKNILKMRQGQNSGGSTEDDKTGDRSLAPNLRIALGWVDTTGSITQDTVPVFPFHTHLISLHPVFPSTMNLPTYLHTINTNLGSKFCSLTPICDLLMDVAKVSALAEVGASSVKDFWTTNAAWAAIYLEPVTNRLLCVRDPVNLLDQSTILQEMLRLALLLYIGPVRGKFGIHVLKMTVQLGKLLSLLQEPVELAVEIDDLKLWIVTMGAMEAFETDMQDQFDGILVQSLVVMGIGSNAVWEKKLKNIMWVSSAHALPFSILRDRLDWES